MSNFDTKFFETDQAKMSWITYNEGSDYTPKQKLSLVPKRPR